MYRHYINAKRDSIQDDLNNDRMLYTEQVALISRVLARKKFGQLKNIKFTKLDVLNARRRKDKKKNEAKHAKQKVLAWATFIHSYHVKEAEEENADGS
jgi:phosphoribosylformylglycinamidine (FGAM) synthase PurS component